MSIPSSGISRIVLFLVNNLQIAIYFSKNLDRKKNVKLNFKEICSTTEDENIQGVLDISANIIKHENMDLFGSNKKGARIMTLLYQNGEKNYSIK